MELAASAVMKIHLNFSQHLIDKFTVNLITSRVKIFVGS